MRAAGNQDRGWY